MTALTIRRAEVPDLPELIGLIRAHAAYERGQAAADANFPERLSRALFGSPNRLSAWVVASAARLHGYASASVEHATWSGRDYLHLDCLYIEENQRGHGLGRLLLAAVESHARTLGLAQMQWQTPAWNRRAIAFYCRAGAESRRKERFFLAVGAGDAPIRQEAQRG